MPAIREASPYDPSLRAFFSSFARTTEHVLVARTLTAPHALIGFCEGSTRAGGVYCSRLAVAKGSRCSGVGAALLRALYAQARTCAPPARVAWLCTLDYQAPRYYPNVGFTAEHTLGGLRAGRVSTYFYRALDDAASAAPAGAPPPPFAIAALPAEGAEEAHAEAQQFVRRQFDEHAREEVGGVSGYFAFALEAVEGEAGREARVGALRAMSYWGLLVLSGVEVREDFRRKGLGRALVQAALARARQEGCTMAVAEALSASECPSFLEAAGFARVGRVQGLEGGEEVVRLALKL